MSSPNNLRSKLALYLSMVRYANAHNRDFAREHYEFFQQMQEHLRPHVETLQGLRVLEIGCGKSMWLSLILNSCGAQVTGIDTEWVSPKMSPAKYLGLLKTNGLDRAARTLAWDALYARPYYRELRRVCPFELTFEGLEAFRSDASSLQLPDQSFDLVVSHEVFEHLSDVPSVLQQVRRLLKPSGLTYIYTHNFASLSGGHHIAWKYPDKEPSTTVPPWDHLRGNRFPEIPSWINGWREHQYKEAFEQDFEIVDWKPTKIEGSELLTDEIREELSDYSEHELLTKGFVTIARRRGSGERVSGA